MGASAPQPGEGLSRVMVIGDGDLASLVCMAIEAERAQGEGGAATPGVVISSWADDAQATAAVQMAEALGLSWIGQDRYSGIGAGGDAGTGHGAPSWARRTRWLLDAATLAAQQGASRLVWPARVEARTIEEINEGVEELAAIANRALLVGRLISVDLLDDAAPNCEAGLTIETPVCDLCDWQVADLAADLAAPVDLCWWMHGTSEEAGRVRAMWLEEFDRVGIRTHAG